MNTIAYKPKTPTRTPTMTLAISIAHCWWTSATPEDDIWAGSNVVSELDVVLLVRDSSVGVVCRGWLVVETTLLVVGVLVSVLDGMVEVDVDMLDSITVEVGSVKIGAIVVGSVIGAIAVGIVLGAIAVVSVKIGVITVGSVKIGVIMVGIVKSRGVGVHIPIWSQEKPDSQQTPWVHKTAGAGHGVLQTGLLEI